MSLWAIDGVPLKEARISLSEMPGTSDGILFLGIRFQFDHPIENVPLGSVVEHTTTGSVYVSGKREFL